MNTRNQLHTTIYLGSALALLFLVMAAVWLTWNAPSGTVWLGAFGAMAGVCAGGVVLLRTADALIGRLEEEELRLEGIINNASDGILTLDCSGLIDSVNPAGVQLFGYRAPEILGNHLSALLASGHAADEAQCLAEFLADGAIGQSTAVFEVRGLRKDGSVFPLELSVSETYQEEIVTYTVIARDVTARRLEQDALEARVRERTRDLEAANALLEAEIERRNAAEAERTKLLERLQDALAHIRTMSGLIPICASCKKVRDDQGYWNQIEEYVTRHSHAEFSHGVCPECVKKLYPDLNLSDESESLRPVQ